MSNTNATHVRFWARMHATYGERWAANYGENPTAPWVEMLNRYTPMQIGAALEKLSERPEMRQHPPTLPAFETLLQATARAARAEMGEAEWRRGYWRSSVVNGVAVAMGYNVAEFEPVLIANKGTLGASMRLLVDELDDMEARTGQRTPGMESHCQRQVRRIASEYAHLRAIRSREPAREQEGETRVPF
jgi:hypothetical protein